MFEAAKERDLTVWVMGGSALLALALACAGCAGIGWELGGRAAWEAAFPEPDPLADLADPTGGPLDLLTVHRSLLPLWILHAGQGEPDTEGEGALAAAIADDPGLSLVEGRLAEELLDPAANADAFLESLDLWNRRIDDLGAPWFVHGVVSGAGGSPQAYVKTYRALYQGEAGSSVGPLRLRLLTRVDTLNVVEGYMGLTADPRTGALVLVDRVAEHALQDLWPLLDPASPDPQAGPLVAEMEAGIPADALAVLVERAPARRGLMDAVHAIQRRRECGSSFLIQDVPYAGFTSDDVAMMADVAWADRGASCPRIRVEESRAIEAASGDADELVPAVEALLAWAARGSAVHEARHAADATAAGTASAVACPGCPEDLDPDARAELSAYLESFAYPGSSAAAWWQACQVGLATSGSHARAIAVAEAELAPDGCTGPIPPDLAARAKDLEARWFARTDAVTLPGDWPDRIRLPGR